MAHIPRVVQGVFTELSSGAESAISTDYQGNWSQPLGVVGLYSWWPGDDTCKDTILKITPYYPMDLYLQPVKKAVITPISLLTPAAGKDVAVLNQLGMNEEEALGSKEVFGLVYKLALDGMDESQLQVGGRLAKGQVLGVLCRVREARTGKHCRQLILVETPSGAKHLGGSAVSCKQTSESCRACLP